MSERFFCESPISGDSATLTGAEAHHLLHVMRLREGARVVLFDGSGHEFTAEVQACGRRDVELAVLAREAIDRETPGPLTLAVALPKGDRQRWLVEKLTELGVATLAPIVTERAVNKLSDGAAAKLHRAVIEACKQCRRNRLTEIMPPAPWEVFSADCVTDGAWLLHPTGEPIDDRLASGETPTTIAVGPEGGFTDDEVVTAIERGWRAVSMGSRILRTETAAVAAASLAIFR
ncbi:MAG: 16S rRNA (uracil(1498)-N(3))-methyltransferase [Planctomycetota bacterium]